MIDRRCAIGLALAAAALPAAWLFPSSARAAQTFQRFTPFLIDLPNWQGRNAEGVSVDMGGNSMITATREYDRGAAHLSAQIFIGVAAQGALAATHTGMKIETSEGHMITSKVGGLPVTRSYTFKDKSGSILVELGDSAMFMLTFNGVTEDEALKLAQAFNWKAMQAVLK